MAAPTNKVCRHCSVALIPEVNWTAGNIKSCSNICRDCKKEKSIEWNRKSGIIARKRSIRYSAKWRQKQKEKNAQYWKANPERRAWHTYKTNAVKRGIIFKLSFEEFVAFRGEPCFYCGNTVLTESGIGVDRFDNSFGYFAHNVVSCCSICNWMKSNLSVGDFINQCKKIVEHTQNVSTSKP